MEATIKKQIQLHLQNYVSRYESQTQAANTLHKVSTATVSQVLNNNWDLIKDSMWQNIAAQTGYKKNSWNTVETSVFKEVTSYLKDAQENSLVLAYTGEAGTGKTYTAKEYVKNNPKAYLLCCNEYWQRRDFLFELLTEMGRDASGMTIDEMMREISTRLKSTYCALIIMDEADKLSDQVLNFFITLYNNLEDHCGIVMCATDHLAKRINRGIVLNKKGFKEVKSRLGRKFIELDEIDITDVTQVCAANGIKDKATIKRIYSDCEGDLRRVRRKIHAELKRVNNQ